MSISRMSVKTYHIPYHIYAQIKSLSFCDKLLFMTNDQTLIYYGVQVFEALRPVPLCASVQE